MECDGGFDIEVTSAYPGWWRYNVALMCGCFDAAGARAGFASAEDRVADVGAALGQPPAGYPARRRTTLHTVPCRRIELYLYVVPHTLPDGREIADTLPFELQLRIRRDGEILLCEKRPVNQWSGLSLALTVQAGAKDAGAL